MIGLDKNHWQCELPAFCIVGLSISSASACRCLCRTSRWMQFRQWRRVSGRTLKRKNVLITNIYMHAHTYTQGYIWDESGMSPNKQRKALWIRYSTAGVQAQWQSFFHWSSNLSCVCVRLLADFSLTTSLGCRLAWSSCWKTPLGAERRGDTLINIT